MRYPVPVAAASSPSLGCPLAAILEEIRRMAERSIPIAMAANATDHESGDERFKLLDAAMKRHRFAPDALIEVLHVAQSVFGHLEPGILYYIAHALKLPPSRVYGVATFYHLFSFAPKGKHTCIVCTGTACYVQGAGRLLAVIEDVAGIAQGETTIDHQVSLLTARCVGTCGMALVVVYDGEVAGGQTPEATQERVKGWLVDGPP
jgi:bidirectional [NiFe] hydrogenase diaphorase subunit